MNGNFLSHSQEEHRKKEDISLYIHVPFCSKKCPYCHFFVLPNSLDNQQFFLTSLKQEWLLRSPIMEEKKIVSIYFGGGTPSLLQPDDIKKILTWVQQGPAHVEDDCEITLEINPESATKDLLKAFARAGINRASIGVQSFDDALLQTLGRTHSSLDAKETIQSCADAGISNISIDLMYELPHQTLAQWEHSIMESLTLPITHLSLYNLVFEPGTTFYKKQKQLSPFLPSGEESLSMLELAVNTFPKKNLYRYEISAFAIPGKESKHNTGYWTGRPFLGIGPSAFSYIEGRRFQNTPQLQKWAEQIKKGKAPENFTEKLEHPARQKELLAIALRLSCGVDMELFTKELGPLDKELEKNIQKLLSEGFLIQKGSRLFLTKQGQNFYDTVASEIV